MKCTARRKKLIIELIEKENPTVTELCRRAGITWQTLKNWRRADPAFDEAVEEAEYLYLADLKAAARTALRRKVEGFHYEEERTEYERGPDGNPVAVRKTVCRRYCPPDARCISMALKNADPANFDE